MDRTPEHDSRVVKLLDALNDESFEESSSACTLLNRAGRQPTLSDLTDANDVLVATLASPSIRHSEARCSSFALQHRAGLLWR